jgi:hypothetical protein
MMRALALLCGLLVAVITAEVWSGWNGDDGTGRAAAAPVVVTPPTAAPGAQRRGSRQQWVTTVLGRPLFAPDRRPDAGAAAADPALPRLAGVLDLYRLDVGICPSIDQGWGTAAKAGGHGELERIVSEGPGDALDPWNHPYV